MAIFIIGLGIWLSLSLTLGDVSSDTYSYKHAAVATDAAPCSVVGTDILKKGGSAIDSAVASLFCIGVYNLQSTGIGGGGFLMFYNATSQESVCIDFREKAPSVISDETMQRYLNDPNSTIKGGLAIGVPGQLKGMYEAHQRFGRLPWSNVVEPAIQLAINGFTITPAIADAIEAVQNDLKTGNYPGLLKLLNPNGRPLKEGEILKQPELAKTLEAIASGVDYFYNSDFTKEMVAELNDQYNSILTVDDFRDYTAVIRPVLTSSYNGLMLHNFPPPASGAVLALILNILDGYNFTEEDFSSLGYHRIVEAFKFSYAQRMSLGDPDYNETINEVVRFMMDPTTADIMRSKITDNTTHDPQYYMSELEYNPPSYGTTHLCVLDEEGNGAAITSTINTYFGSLVRSNTSGIIFNNEMDDFGVPGRNNTYDYPPSPANYLRASHRPLSSSVPTIVTKNGEIVMIAGASGGSRIPTSTSQVLLDVLSFGMTLSDAVDIPRLHHQLLPNYIKVESDFPSLYINGLKRRHHVIKKTGSLATVQAIYKENGIIYAASDRRKGGKPSGY